MVAVQNITEPTIIQATELDTSISAAMKILSMFIIIVKKPQDDRENLAATPRHIARKLTGFLNNHITLVFSAFAFSIES